MVSGFLELPGVAPGEDAGATGGAQSVIAMAVVQAHPASCDAVDVGRLIDAAAIGADRVRRVVVAHDEQDVGLAHVSLLCEGERVTWTGSTSSTTGCDDLQH